MLLGLLALTKVLIEPERSHDSTPAMTAGVAPELLEPEVELARGPGRERPGTGARIWIAADELRFADRSGGAESAAHQAR